MGYIKERKLVFTIYLVFIAIFAIIFCLYNLNIEPLLYGIVLITTIFLILITLDLILYIKKHRELHRLKKYIDITLDEMPNAIGIIEKDYQDLIQILSSKYKETVLKSDLNQKETIDYYTVWAHQIKTPISAMSLLLQLNGEVNKKELKTELFKIDQYVDMVLNYLRIDSGASDLVIQNYDLSNIIKAAVKKYANIFITKNISLELEDIDQKVLTDEKWLSFVIEQLLSNALKYTDSGSIKIYMDKIKDNTLVIEDNGIGISEEDLPRIFDKGFTGYNGRMDKKASGIGLYLCKKVLNKLAHKLTTTSKTNIGTKVYIDFSREYN